MAKEVLPRIYLSGSFSMNVAKQKEWIVRTKCQYQCFSFAFVEEGAFYYSQGMKDMLQVSLDAGVGIMMDSGAFSFHKFMKKKPSKGSGPRYHLADSELREQTIQLYVDFIKRRGHEFDFYVNFDYTKDVGKVYEIQKRLESMGIQPIPVFHGGDSLDWWKKYLEEGYNYVGAGTMANARSWLDKVSYYDSIFNLVSKYETRGRKIKVHGFGLTYPSAMWTWPWYSVDSTTWCMNGAMGRILIPTLRGLKAFHCSEREADLRQATNLLEPSAMKSVIDLVESKGFDFAAMRKSKQERDIWNGMVFSNLGEWKDRWLEHRGERVKWQEVI